MNITFFQYFTYENLSIEYISSVLKQAGHNVNLIVSPQIPIFKKNIEQIIQEIKATSPDLIAYSSTTCEYQPILKTAKEIKKHLPDIKTIIGGIHPTATYHLIKKEKCFDYICVGEGEKSFLTLLNRIEENKTTDRITNIIHTNSPIHKKINIYDTDLNTLPFPDKDLIYNTYPAFIRDSYTIITSRGCPYNCTFCYNSINNKIPLTRRTPQNVLAELKISKEKYNPKTIFFLDSVFTYSKEWLDMFLPEYKREISKPFYCDIHPLCINESIVSALKEAGCSCVNLGIQTSCEKKRKTIFNRHETNQQIKETIRLIKKYNITLYAHIIYDLPNEQDKDILTNAKFINKYKPDIIVPFSLTYYPKTQLTKNAATEKTLKTKTLKNIYQGKNFESFNKTPTRKQAQLMAFLLISSLIPKKIFIFLLTNNRYKLLPSASIFRFYLLLMPLYICVFRKKSNFPFFYIHKKLKFILFFIFKAIKTKI